MSAAVPEAAAVLAAQDQRAIGGVWAFRAQLEDNAADRFSRLGQRLQGVGAQPGVVDLARRAVTDERRHAALCATMADRYRGAASAPAPSMKEIAPPRFELRDRVLYEAVAFCCLTETINAGLMSTTLRVAKVPIVRSAVREILRDEVWHARLGWAHLASERALGRGDFLGELLPRMLRGTVQEELFGPEDANPAVRELIVHGELPKEDRLVSRNRSYC